ncbi:nucleoside kinase [Cellulosilyticum lentocellum]|uniref:Phosphoribulokinase/uridine kinase n=1 Tax=Cellulosilyticum lentocellum (strain ATCC 49066 / DSM 5427 / NCIMB 11756 / RHM5) TaxID=642492 RepID=F2JST7_CELLD|nr:nucleoside kinase [Cellulosilyticum lentocellum]ADZ84058.1 phosphoribulokinase/uridine kinase [Cellulosilyticum lentocellum DSM 5427]
MSKMVRILFKDGKEIQVEKGTTFEELAEKVKGQGEYPIMLAETENSYKELASPILHDLSAVRFIYLNEKDGMRVYQRSATFLLVAAAKRIFPGRHIIVNHHIAGGYFCEFKDDGLCSDENIQKLEEMMWQMVREELPIRKEVLSVEQAMELFEAEGMLDKKELFKYRRTSTVNIYRLDEAKDYFYGYMLTNTKAIQLFKLIPYAHGFILQFPDEKDPSHLKTFVPQPKLSNIFRESERWARILGVDTVSALNNVIAKGEIDELIKISEALHEKRIAEIADQIVEKKHIKLVLIAGPSSSGKTTSAKRLGIQLKVNGMKPHVVSIDDYFVDREHTPRDEKGDYDFEALEAIDIQLFNEHMKALIEGKEVEVPTFNFVTGKREYKGNKIKLTPDEILIVEGIHGLNEKLSYAIPAENKFKIYVSCLTQLNIDEHNRIPTTDTRLIRRMVRDNQYRGIDPEKTLAIWASVRRGENKNIFPFQEEADAMLNTVLIYELAVLKSKAEPLLFRITRQSPYYAEAKRMLKFLEYFLPMDTSEIPSNSLIREFLGGSSFQ